MNYPVHRTRAPWPPNSSLLTRAALAWACTCACATGCASGSGTGATPEVGVRTLTFEAEASCPASAQQCWTWFTQDVDQWWDHTFSDSPHALVLDARVGGSFYESFDGAGNGAEHARVIYAKKPEMMRLDGPLGLSGLAVHMVHELRFEPGAGGETRVSVRVQMSGAVDDETASAVEGVWQHFLVERFEAYAKGQAAGRQESNEG